MTTLPDCDGPEERPETECLWCQRGNHVRCAGDGCQCECLVDADDLPMMEDDR